MKVEEVIKEFDYRSYRIEIYPSKVVFRAYQSDGRERLEKIEDLPFFTSEERDSIDWAFTRAQEIINDAHWRYMCSNNGAKIMVRYTADESKHGWLFKIVKQDGTVTRGGVYPSRSQAIWAAISTMGKHKNV